MQMRLADFRKQDRGSYLSDSWLWEKRLATKLGDLPVVLLVSDDDPAPPDEEMIAIADELAKYAKSNDEMLIDLIYGHYRYAEKNGWLEFWNVPARLSRDGVLSQVESIGLHVQRDRDEETPYDAAVCVNPNWDQEHKLRLHYRKGEIVAVNDEPFILKNGLLYPQ